MKDLIAIALIAALSVSSAPTAAGHRLDAAFHADRVIVTLPVRGGTALRFYTDTGGGGTLIYPDAASRLKLGTAPITGPAAEEFPKSFRRLVGDVPVTGALRPPPPVYVAPDFIAAMGGPAEADGFLGSAWFAGGIWTWDYPRQRLTREDDRWTPPRTATIVPVHFKPGGAGGQAPAFPRIVVMLAGEPVSVLLDTGAETLLTPAAVGRVGGGPALRATSMIVSSRFEAWHVAHPDWPIVDGAQMKTGARMIRVPDVAIAGFPVGPVWFTERPDAAFHGMMSSAMDAQVEGAIGGNAFRTLRMTVDYRGARAAFERP